VTAAFSYAFGQMARGGVGQSSGPGEEPGEATFKVGRFHPMTEGEIAMAQDVFGSDVDYSKFKVLNRKFRFFQKRGDVVDSPSRRTKFTTSSGVLAIGIRMGPLFAFEKSDSRSLLA